jgi:hypothetical protein
MLAMCGSIVVVLLIRSALHRKFGNIGSDSVADTVMEPLAGVYGLLLAFLVSGVAGRAGGLRTAMQAEAEAFHRVEQIAERLPAPIGSKLQLSLRRYAQAESAVRSGKSTAQQSEPLLNDIWLSLATFEPSGTREEVLQSEALDDVRTLREQRAVAARSNVHAYGFLVWVVLIVGSVSVVGICAVASLADPRAPLYLAGLTAMIVVTLYVLWALSRPLPDPPFQGLTH